MGRDGRSGQGRRRTHTIAVTAAIGLLLTRSPGVQAEESHDVASGDTLAALAAQHGVTVEDLAEANGLDPATPLWEGQALNIPTPPNQDITTYEVAPGDTLASIAVSLGITSDSLVAANDAVDVDDLIIGSTLVVPTDQATMTEVATILTGVPAYRQQRALSCEYASIYIATSAFGAPIPEEDLIAAMPQSTNPHLGFRGDIDGVWGNTVDYGVYAEALVPTLADYGFDGEVSYGADAATLRAQLDAGRPTIVWLSYWGDTGFYEADETGSFKLVPGEHVVVAYGYDAGGVYLANPGNGTLQYYGWDAFLGMWSVMDGMALAVFPG